MYRLRAALAHLKDWLNPGVSGGLTWIRLHRIVIAALVAFIVGSSSGVVGTLTVQRFEARGGYKPGPLPPQMVLRGGTLPDHWSLARFITRVHYQGASNSCVSQTLSAMDEIAQMERGHRIAFSPGYIYNQLQVNGGGLTYQAAFGVLTIQGDAPYGVFPYDGVSNYWVQPDAAARAAAAPYRFTGYRSIAASDRYTMEAEIHAGRPFAIAIPVTDAYYNLFGSWTSIPTVTGQYGAFHFYHSITGIGYDQSGLITLGSWGPQHGYRGLVRLSWGFIQAVNAEIVASTPVAPMPKHRKHRHHSSRNKRGNKIHPKRHVHHRSHRP